MAADRPHHRMASEPAGRTDTPKDEKAQYWTLALTGEKRKKMFNKWEKADVFQDAILKHRTSNPAGRFFRVERPTNDPNTWRFKRIGGPPTCRATIEPTRARTLHTHAEKCVKPRLKIVKDQGGELSFSLEIRSSRTYRTQRRTAKPPQTSQWKAAERYCSVSVCSKLY